MTGKFNFLIGYLKYASLFAGIYCLAAMFFISFDPYHYLEDMIVQDLLGTPVMSAEGRKLFEFNFLLFSLLSALYFLLQYQIIEKALAKKEKWAANILLTLIFLWIAGTTAIVLHTKAFAYFMSIAVMAILFMPPLILVKLKIGKE